VQHRVRLAVVSRIATVEVTSQNATVHGVLLVLEFAALRVHGLHGALPDDHNFVGELCNTTNVRKRTRIKTGVILKVFNGRTPSMPRKLLQMLIDVYVSTMWQIPNIFLNTLFSLRY
jgi:hypothetical protein